MWWVAAEEAAAIPGQFIALAVQLGMHRAVDPDALQAQVHSRLRGVPNWLLIFDNANTIEDIQPWLPTEPQAAGVRSHVIVTTRRSGFGALGKVLDLDVMPLPDALRLLRTRVRSLGQEAGKQIAEELGRLPLALEAAAAYLDRSQLAGPEYLQLLHSHAADLFQDSRVATHDETIATLWDLNLQRLDSESPAAIQMLTVSAYLAPEPIPLDLFTTHRDRLPQPLRSAAGDPLAFTDAIAASIDYSLAKRTPSGLQLHRLVQAALRARHAQPEPVAGASPTPSLTSHQAAAPRQGRATQAAANPLAVALTLLRADAPDQVVASPAAWPRWAVLLPHVLAATSHLDHHTGLTNPTVTNDSSWLLDRAASYLWVHVRPAEAKPLLERALAIDEATYGPYDPTVARDLNNLAEILRDLGQPETARPLQERALAIDEAFHGPDHPEVATHLNNLATILRDLGQPGAARPLLERAVAIDEAAYGPDDPQVARDLNNLAPIMQALGQPEAARPLQERALAITEAAYGRSHPNVAIRLNNLAQIQQALGQPEAARPLLERALAITEAAYGSDHPAVAARLSNLAQILQALGRPEAARPLQERAQAIAEATRSARTD